MIVGLSAIATVPVAARRTPMDWLRPSLLDCLVIALLVWLVGFTATGGEAGLLQDANTGYHIRVGDYVLEHRAVPHTDIFLFTRGGQPWYAWEWLSGVLFSALHGAVGLKGIVLFAAALIASTIAILVRHLVWRGGGALVILFLVHIGVAVSSLHFLARPHLFTLLFVAVSLYVLDRDLARPSPQVYLLIPLAALWANLHGGFIVLPVLICCLAVGAHWRRYLLLAGACLLASGLNPYGFSEHAHIVRYMNAGWIRRIVEEFQGPHFDGLAGLYSEVLVLGSAMLVLSLLLRRDFGHALLVALWVHAGMQSVRHLPVLAVVVLPLAAPEVEALWQRFVSGAPRGSIRQTLAGVSSDYTGALARLSVWPVAACVLIAVTGVLPFPTDFPEPRYPVSMVNRHAGLLESSRVFSTDSAGDYMEYRLWPRARVFIDGRSDMYGPALAEQYMTALNGVRGWDRVLARYGVNAALLPSNTALATLLRREPGWTTIEDGRDFALFQRTAR